MASLGLTYSAVPGPEDIYSSSGLNNISVPDLTHFTQNARISNDFYGEALDAHILGDIGSSYNFSDLPEQSLVGSPLASNPAAFWNATDHWQFIAVDSTPADYSIGPGVLSIYADRVVTSSGVCSTPAYDVSAVAADGSHALNAPKSTIYAAQFTLRDSGEVVLFPLDAFNGEGTYYLSSNSSGDCGPGCSNVKVVETYSGPPAGSFFNVSNGIYFYDCNITVTPPTDRYPGSLPLEQAALAARAIALSGAIPQLGDSEYVFYQLDVAFGQAQNNSAAGMASQLSRFAIGVVAAAARTNRPILVQGKAPAQGLRLTLDQPLAFGLILGLTAGIQLLLVLVTATACRKLVIPKETPVTRRETFRKYIAL